MEDQNKQDKKRVTIKPMEEEETKEIKLKPSLTMTKGWFSNIFLSKSKVEAIPQET